MVGCAGLHQPAQEAAPAEGPEAAYAVRVYNVDDLGRVEVKGKLAVATACIMMRTHLDIRHLSAYVGTMRTTLTIDDELLAAARSLARDRSESVGEAVSELIRRGLRATPGMRKAPGISGFPVFRIPSGEHPITLEDVRRAEDAP